MAIGKPDDDASGANAEPPRRLSKASHSAAKLAPGACLVSVLSSYNTPMSLHEESNKHLFFAIFSSGILSM